MSEQAYTLAMYRVKPGKEDEFLQVWNELAAVFSSLPSPPMWGSLIRHLTDRTLFYSFGPWRNASHVRAMRESPSVGATFARLQAVCEQMTPGDFELVRHVDLQQR